jgi:hypothetical protein
MLQICFLLLGILCATVENLALFHIIDEQNNATIPFYRVARDGIVANTIKLDYIVLGGAQRLEILFRIDKPGNFFVCFSPLLFTNYNNLFLGRCPNTTFLELKKIKYPNFPNVKKFSLT